MPAVCQFWNISSCWISWSPDLASSSYTVKKQNTDNRKSPTMGTSVLIQGIYKCAMISQILNNRKGTGLKTSRILFFPSKQSLQGQAFPLQQEKLQDKKIMPFRKKVYIYVYMYVHRYVYVYTHTCVRTCMHIYVRAHTHSPTFWTLKHSLSRELDTHKLPAIITCSSYWSYWQYLPTNYCICSFTYLNTSMMLNDLLRAIWHTLVCRTNDHQLFTDISRSSNRYQKFTYIFLYSIFQLRNIHCRHWRKTWWEKQGTKVEHLYDIIHRINLAREEI